MTSTGFEEGWNIFIYQNERVKKPRKAQVADFTEFIFLAIVVSALKQIYCWRMTNFIGSICITKWQEVDLTMKISQTGGNSKMAFLSHKFSEYDYADAIFKCDLCRYR